MTIDEYARALVQETLRVARGCPLCVDHRDLDAIIASVPKPDVQAQTDAAVARERDRVIGIFVGELQKLHEKTVLDCGDNSCLFATRRGGMRTNGGCRCIERLLDAAVARERERWQAAIRDHLECHGPATDFMVEVAGWVDCPPWEIRARSGAKGV